MELKPPISFLDTSIAFSSKSDRALKRMQILFGMMNYPWLVNLGTKFIKLALKIGLPIKPVIKNTIFDHFCGGETIEECRSSSLELGRFGIDTILDYSVEGSENEADFDHTLNETLNTIEKARIEPKNPFCVFKASGLASNHLLEHLQSGKVLTEEQSQAWERVKRRVRRICQAAADNNIKVLVDAEESWIQQPIDALAYDLMRQFNTNTAVIYNTYQMYRSDMMQNLREAFHSAVSGQYYLGVKLVRGAYMEKERDRAEEMDYPSPIHPNKQATDDAFNQALKFCINNFQRIDLCCGSHNEYSNYYLTVLMNKYRIKPEDTGVYFAQLYGMSDNISFNLAHGGYNVAKYLPYGPIEKVMPYLFRRAEENTAISGQTNHEFALITREIARRKAETNHK